MNDQVREAFDSQKSKARHKQGDQQQATKLDDFVSMLASQIVVPQAATPVAAPVPQNTAAGVAETDLAAVQAHAPAEAQVQGVSQEPLKETEGSAKGDVLIQSKADGQAPLNASLETATSASAKADVIQSAEAGTGLAADGGSATAAPTGSDSKNAAQGSAQAALTQAQDLNDTIALLVPNAETSSIAAASVGPSSNKLSNKSANQSTSFAATPNPRSSAGQFAQQDPATGPQPATITTATTGNPAQSVLGTSHKSQEAALDAVKPSQSPDAAQLTQPDNAATMEPANSGATPDAAPTQASSDLTTRPSLITAQTLPTLATAMFRRFSNGLRDFTLRLDPPELGRVDVKITVGPNKKVRAVVSTDKPEALVDLTRSARELANALKEAGLDLEENGLSFSMNDHSGTSQQNRRERDGASPIVFPDTAAAETATEETMQGNRFFNGGPVERWQRARVALTA